MLLYVGKALAEGPELLDEAERTKIESLRAVLVEAKDAEDRQAIVEAVQRLDEEARPLAERIMNRSMQQLLSEKSVDEIDA